MKLKTPTKERSIPLITGYWVIRGRKRGGMRDEEGVERERERREEGTGEREVEEKRDSERKKAQSVDFKNGRMCWLILTASYTI